MNKKQLMALVNGLVARVVEHDATLEEAEARTLVGIALRQHGNSIVAKCIGIVEPAAEPHWAETPAVETAEIFAEQV